MFAEVETMFYLRKEPWHGLGTQVMEAPNSREASVSYTHLTLPTIA